MVLKEGSFSFLSKNQFMDKKDYELIEKCINGDRKAWELLYGLYAVKVGAFVSAFGFDGAEREDVCQEIFIDLFKSLKSFRGEASLQTFVLKIAKYRCISLYRNKKAAKRGGGAVEESIEETDSRGDEAGIIAEDPAPGAEQLVIMKEEAAELLSHLSKLSPDCRMIIEKRYFAELSYSEICSEMGLPIGTMCSKLKRCLDYLKRLFNKAG